METFFCKTNNEKVFHTCGFNLSRELSLSGDKLKKTPLTKLTVRIYEIN